jgi:hypothetical protein
MAACEAACAGRGPGNSLTHPLSLCVWHACPVLPCSAVNRIVNQQLPASAVVGYRDAALLPMHSSADHQSSDDLRSLALASSAQMEP